jgi:hypothetical protein
MPFVYLHRSDGKRSLNDPKGRYFIDQREVQYEAKRLLVQCLLETEVIDDIIGMSVEARDLSGKTLFQVSVTASTW